MINSESEIIIDEIFSVNDNTFTEKALQVFRFQYAENGVYKEYCDNRKIDPRKIYNTTDIPFLPIQFFKSRQVSTTIFSPEAVFESSGTTGSVNSKHHVKNIMLYEKSFLSTFKQMYGAEKIYCILGLLPSYLERSNSSLVWMTRELIKRSENPQSGFYLHDYEKLYNTIKRNEQAGQPTLLIGVTFALLDFAEKYPIKLTHTIVMETGGMKGRKEEITREEVHQILQTQFGNIPIHSEYGMTELLSQAYAKQSGLFETPGWMKLLIRSEDDPFNVRSETDVIHPTTGVANIIDLANLYSCSFIATDDIARLYPTGNFEILGRLDNSDIRGCGLMVI